MTANEVFKQQMVWFVVIALMAIGVTIMVVTPQTTIKAATETRCNTACE